MNVTSNMEIETSSDTGIASDCKRKRKCTAKSEPEHHTQTGETTYGKPCGGGSAKYAGKETKAVLRGPFIGLDMRCRPISTTNNRNHCSAVSRSKSASDSETMRPQAGTQAKEKVMITTDIRHSQKQGNMCVGDSWCSSCS